MADDDDKLRKSDLTEVEIALLSRGMRNPQFSRILAPLRAALAEQRILTKSAPQSRPADRTADQED